MKEESEARNVIFDPDTLPIDEQLLTPGNIKFKLHLSTFTAFLENNPDVQPSLKWLLDAGNYNAMLLIFVNLLRTVLISLGTLLNKPFDSRSAGAFIGFMDALTTALVRLTHFYVLRFYSLFLSSRF